MSWIRFRTFALLVFAVGVLWAVIAVAMIPRGSSSLSEQTWLGLAIAGIGVVMCGVAEAMYRREGGIFRG